MLRPRRLPLLLPLSTLICLCLGGCAPVSLRIPWGLSRLPWTVAYVDEQDRMHVQGVAEPVFEQPLTAHGAAASPLGAHVAVVTAEGQLWVVPVVAGRPVQLDGGKVAADFWPDVSPWSLDGRALVYVSGGDVVYRRLTRRPRKLTSTSDAFTAALSPDGKMVAYGRRSADLQDLGLWVVPVRGGEARQVAPAGGDVFSACCPHWSGDGQWIAFLQAYEGGALGVVRADGSDLRTGIEAAWEPVRWLADSSMVLFAKVYYGEGGDGIWSYSPGQSGPRLLWGKGQQTTYALSPLGDVALVAMRKGDQQTFTHRRLPGEVKGEDFTLPGVSASCAYAPDGGAVSVAVTSAAGQQSLYLLPRSKREVRRVAATNGLAGWVRHSPPEE